MAAEGVCVSQGDTETFCGRVKGGEVENRELPHRVMAAQSFRSSGSCEDQLIHTQLCC